LVRLTKTGYRGQQKGEEASRNMRADGKGEKGSRGVMYLVPNYVSRRIALVQLGPELLINGAEHAG
jgi:hypothetical protein